MRLIIGLGNPGKEYEQTRHNIGFTLLDSLSEAWHFPAFNSNKKFTASLSEGLSQGEKILLVKPETYMNLSGESVRALVTFYKIPIENILVIHDDLDLPSGTTRWTEGASSAGHNGVQSIIDCLGTQTFARLRVGIGRPASDTVLAPRDYVLQTFTPEEASQFKTLTPDIIQSIEQFISTH